MSIAFSYEETVPQQDHIFTFDPIYDNNNININDK